MSTAVTAIVGWTDRFAGLDIRVLLTRTGNSRALRTAFLPLDDRLRGSERQRFNTLT